MSKDKIRVIMLRPGKRATVEVIDASLSGMQELVGGYIQAVYPFDDPVAIVCNEEGKLNGLEMNRALREALLTESGALRFKGDDFLGHVPPRYQGIVSSLLGAMIAAAHNGAMIVLDSEAVQIVARYAAKIVPELRSFLLPVEPPLTGIGAQLPGLTAACGLQIIRASLFMLNEMKTFDETNVSTASDGPGAKRQHR